MCWKFSPFKIRKFIARRNRTYGKYAIIIISQSIYKNCVFLVYSVNEATAAAAAMAAAAEEGQEPPPGDEVKKMVLIFLYFINKLNSATALYSYTKG